VPISKGRFNAKTIRSAAKAAPNRLHLQKTGDFSQFWSQIWHWAPLGAQMFF
jgi:hypothetical protein